MIYILGNSHSGSTLLGFLLAAHPEIVNLGELKSRTWLKSRHCSCGQQVNTCPFYESYLDTFNAMKQTAFNKVRESKPIKFLFRKNVHLDNNSAEILKTLYQSISHQVRSTTPEAKYLVDTSKSIWLLNAWLKIIPHDDIKIILLKRKTKATVSSFIKRGAPFFPTLIAILTNNWLMHHYLKRNKLNYLEVDYNRFYDAYADEARAMSNLIGLNLPIVNMRPIHHHVISGNAKTRQAFTNQFTGLHKDEEWKRILTTFQKNILRLIS